MVCAILIQQFRPSQISGCSLWLDGTNPAWAKDNTRPSNSSGVSSWKDQSGSANDFSQATGANQPTYQTSIINGSAALLGNSTTRNMSGGSTGFATGSNGRTIFTIIRPVSVGSTMEYFCTGTYAANQALNHAIWANPGPSTTMVLDWNSNTSGATTTALSSATNYRTSLNFANGTNNASVTLKVNDVSQSITVGGSTTTPNTVNSATMLFSRQDNNSYYDGYIGEVIYYNVNLTASQISLVNTYLKNKWRF